MEPFATVEDLESRWRVLDDSEKKRADVLLCDASAYLVSLLDNSNVVIDTENEIQMASLTMVCCAMVKRMIGVDEEFFGVTQFSKTAGSFTASGTAANPHGDMYLTSSEKNLLGISATGRKQKASFVRVAIHNQDGSMSDAW